MASIMNKATNFTVKINCLVIGTDLKNGKQYILSTDSSDIVFPVFELDNNTKSDIEKSVISYLNNYIVCNELELMPQLITLHSEYFPKTKKKNMINSVYSSVVNKDSQINNSHWIEFDFSEPTIYSNLIFEAIRKLK